MQFISESQISDVNKLIESMKKVVGNKSKSLPSHIKEILDNLHNQNVNMIQKSNQYQSFHDHQSSTKVTKQTKLAKDNSKSIPSVHNQNCQIDNIKQNQFNKSTSNPLLVKKHLSQSFSRDESQNKKKSNHENDSVKIRDQSSERKQFKLNKLMQRSNGLSSPEIYNSKDVLESSQETFEQSCNSTQHVNLSVDRVVMVEDSMYSPAGSQAHSQCTPTESKFLRKQGSEGRFASTLPHGCNLTNSSLSHSLNGTSHHVKANSLLLEAQSTPLKPNVLHDDYQVHLITPGQPRTVKKLINIENQFSQNPLTSNEKCNSASPCKQVQQLTNLKSEVKSLNLTFSGIKGKQGLHEEDASADHASALQRGTDTETELKSIEISAATEQPRAIQNLAHSPTHESNSHISKWTPSNFTNQQEKKSLQSSLLNAFNKALTKKITNKQNYHKV